MISACFVLLLLVYKTVLSTNLYSYLRVRRESRMIKARALEDNKPQDGFQMCP